MALRLNRKVLESLTPAERELVERDLAELDALLEADPLQGFEPNCAEQEKFLSSKSRTVAAFAGNQAGKTTSLVVRALIEVSPRDQLPKSLRPFKRSEDGRPVFGRVVCPGAKQLSSVLIPTFRRWTPKHLLKGGSFAKAWEKQQQILQFADGSFIDFLTYETDLDKFGGPQRHFVGYDEPPPRDIRDEGLARLVRFNGFEMFALTPLKANTGWIRREVWRKRESPDVTVAKWSIHDNKALSREAVKYFLDSLPSDLWRRAREFGDFVDVGGLIYPAFEDHLVPRPESVKGLDVVVGIDPGLRNAAMVWVGFDRDNHGIVFDEVLLQQSLPADYAEAMRTVNCRWGVSDVTYVIDPSFRVRSLSNAENVESALAREGIYCVPGQNAVEAGCMQVRQRMEHGMLSISQELLGLRDEADEYAMEDRDDGKFVEARNDNSHRLDCLRYACMYRAWDPVQSVEVTQNNLGYRRDVAPAAFALRGRSVSVGPMGDMS